MIPGNQDLEKSRSVSNLRMTSGPSILYFFQGPRKKLGLYHKPEKYPGDKLKNKSRFGGAEIFLRFETDLNFSRP